MSASARPWVLLDASRPTVVPLLFLGVYDGDFAVRTSASTDKLF